MKYLIDHKTTYKYFEPVSLCHNIARLVPRDTEWQYCRNVVVRIDPEPDTVNKYEDFFGNNIIYFSIEKEHTQLTVHVRSEIESLDRGLLRRGHGVTEDMTEVRQFVVATPMTAWDEEIGAYARVSFAPGRPVPEAAADLMSRIYAEFEFKPGFTTVASPLKVVMRERKGVCQDFAHLAIACVRSVGVPARYVSGYIETISPSGGESCVVQRLYFRAGLGRLRSYEQYTTRGPAYHDRVGQGLCGYCAVERDHFE